MWNHDVKKASRIFLAIKFHVVLNQRHSDELLMDCKVQVIWSIIFCLDCVGIFRSSSSKMFFKIGVLKNFIKFTEKHLCWNLFLNTAASWRPATLLRKNFGTVFFFVNYAKLLITPFLQKTSGRLLLMFLNCCKKFLLLACKKIDSGTTCEKKYHQ